MQSYKSHAHQPVPTIVASAFWMVALVAFLGSVLAGWDGRDLAFGALLVAVFVTIAIGRLYTTKLQDRIILLEMQVRCAQLLPDGADAALAGLAPKQVVALRFASDEELRELLARAAAERLGPDAIKQAIRSWRPDYNRT